MSFTTTDEVAIRLGGITLTAEQTAQAQLLIELATGIIADGVGKTDEWAAELDPVPIIIRSVTLEAIWRVMAPSVNNPSGASSESETLGAYSHTVRYGENGYSAHAEVAGLGVTDAEMRKCRLAVWGRLSATTMPATTLDLAIELCETGEIAAFPAE